METYVIFRRNGWSEAADLAGAAARASDEGERMAEDVVWIRSYALAERDGRFGTVCVYRASSPEAIRCHSAAAELPIDEIVEVADTIVTRREPPSAAAH
jgi:hypothetical protein